MRINSNEIVPTQSNTTTTTTSYDCLNTTMMIKSTSNNEINAIEESLKQAPLHQNSETRLFFTIIGSFVVLLTPMIGLLVITINGVIHHDYQRALASITSLWLILYPMYFSSRWKLGLIPTIISTVRYLLLPVLLGFALVPTNTRPEIRGVIWAVNFILWAILYEFRRRSRAEPAVDNHLRIMVIADALPPKVDGVATFAEHSIALLQEFGHEVFVVTSARGLAGQQEKMWGAKVFRLPGMSTPISQDHSVTLPLPSVMLEMMKFKPHVIHLFEVSPLNLASFFFCHLIDIPCTFSHHTRLDLYVSLVMGSTPVVISLLVLSTLERFFYPLGDAHLTVSKALFDRVNRRGAHDVKLWHSGVSKQFDKNKRSEKKRLEMTKQAPSNVPLVIYVGRLAPEKNTEELAEIFQLTSDAMGGQDKIRFAIVGDGIARKEVEAQMSKLHNVHFCGVLRGTPLQEAFASADVFFSPSTTEGFPLVFLEALSSGLAVVGPRAGGIPDMFNDGVEGYLFPAHDKKSASEAIVNAIKSGGQPMRDRAYVHGKQFTWERVVRDLEATLFEVIEKQRKGREIWI
jgi:glycosyltransferase involved in cell wall biosynthesis